MLTPGGIKHYGTSIEWASASIKRTNGTDILLIGRGRQLPIPMVPPSELDVFLRVVLLGLACLLTFLAAASALRQPDRRFLLLPLAFGAFAVKGLLLVLAIFFEALNPIGQSLEVTSLDMAILGLLYIASVAPSARRASA